MNSSPEEMAQFIGRFHALLVHMPIGLISLVFFLELIGRWPRFQHATAVNGIILALAAPAAACSAVCGWLLSQSGGYEAQLLGWHKWAGIGVATACAFALLLHWLKKRLAYDLVLTSTFAGLVVASHFGGSLTHGSDYLTRYAPDPLRGWLGGKPHPDPAAKALIVTNRTVFVSSVMPILERTCVNCHGPEKAKGGLRLDSFEALVKGSENGPVLEPGKSGTSSLVQRLLLPIDHDDHMPPDGKPQPTAEEIAAIKRWIDSGANGSTALTESGLSANPRSL